MTDLELVASLDLPDEQKRVLEVWIVELDVAKTAKTLGKTRPAIRTSLYRSREVYLNHKNHTDRVEELAERQKKRKLVKVLIG